MTMRLGSRRMPSCLSATCLGAPRTRYVELERLGYPMKVWCAVACARRDVCVRLHVSDMRALSGLFFVPILVFSALHCFRPWAWRLRSLAPSWTRAL